MRTRKDTCMSERILVMKSRRAEAPPPIPVAGLLLHGEPPKLCVESASWDHVAVYAQQVESIPENFSAGSAGSEKVLTALRAAARGIGSPGQLRASITMQPNFLASDRPPAGAWQGMAWLAHQLYTGAAAMAGFPAGDPGAGADRRLQLLEMLGIAEERRRGATELSVAMRLATPRIMTVHEEFAMACMVDAEVLQEAHQSLGALQFQIESVEKLLQELGWLGAKSTRKELEKQLRDLQEELQIQTGRAESLRNAFTMLEQILEEGAWLQSGLTNGQAFVDGVAAMWTSVELSLAELTSGATNEQLEDRAWLHTALGKRSPIEGWRGLVAAGRKYAMESLVDRNRD